MRVIRWIFPAVVWMLSVAAAQADFITDTESAIATGNARVVQFYGYACDPYSRGKPGKIQAHAREYPTVPLSVEQYHSMCRVWERQPSRPQYPLHKEWLIIADVHVGVCRFLGYRAVKAEV